MELIDNYIIPNWLFIVTTLFLAMTGQVAKATLWTEGNIKKYRGKKMGQIIWWGRKTLPLHPVILGAVISFVPGLPYPEAVATAAAKFLYMAGAGVMSTWAFALLKGALKKADIEIEIPRESVVPETPKTPESTGDNN